MPREALFDLAVNRAASYAERVGALTPPPDAAALREALEVWYLKTRFAYRIPLEEVIGALLRRPGAESHWAGGPAGGWEPGATPQP